MEKPAYGPASPGKQPDYSQGENTPAPEPAAPAQPEETAEESQPEPAPSQPEGNTLEEHRAREEESSAPQTNEVQSSGALKPGYNAEPVGSKMHGSSANENLPMLGKSPPMSINYQTGEVLLKGTSKEREV